MKELSPSLKEFCEKQQLLRLAYADDRGRPRVVPLWFVVMHDDYYVGTGATSAKWKAIKRDARVGWVIDGGENGKYKGASMYGRAEEVTDQNERALIHRWLAMKYFGSAEDPKFIEIYGESDDAETVYIRLKSEGGISWEY
ncbi:MAG TPA: pyridoxamine 5'-phosphate oxidase family protein [Blastocatellia bacterium]|jgi:nitroimidazol reductase NimA-like FMN-containing flavoprotein (pyridoxamine 5'-phosphate oxidase superfamily)